MRRLAVINDHHGLAREAADWSRLPGVEIRFHGRVGDAQTRACWPAARKRASTPP